MIINEKSPTWHVICDREGSILMLIVQGFDPYSTRSFPDKKHVKINDFLVI